MDTIDIDDNILLSQGDVTRRNQSHRRGMLCLVLLCAALLAGNIGQLISYKIISRSAQTDTTQANYNALTQNKSDDLTTKNDKLQSSYDALAVKKKQLDITLSNLTLEKDQLEQRYKSASTEMEKLEDSLKTVTSERDKLQANYSVLKQESEQLKTSYDDAQKSLEGLQANHSNLTTDIKYLQNKYSYLEREKNELQTRFTALAASREQLESNYSSLRRDKEQLHRHLNIMNVDKSQMETSYNSLWRDKNQLQTRHNTLTKEKEQLQTKYDSLAADREHLRKKLDKMTVKVRGIVCQTQWTKFETSCYFVSTTKRNWTESRQACIAEGADLVIIDSHDEQVFVNGLLNITQNAWIGFTDSLNEGVWMWVDGTPVTTTYWQPGQPNSYTGDQDCGEFVQYSSEGMWNDDGCFAEQNWICEK